MIMDGKRQSDRMKMGWVALVLVTLLLGVLIAKGWDRGVLATETYEELKTFTEVLALVQKHYVEEVKTKDLVYGAIRGMLMTLDPHSRFVRRPEGGVGVQRHEHAPDRAIDQILGLDLFHVVLLDKGQHLGEGFQLFVGLGRQDAAVPAFCDENPQEQGHENQRHPAHLHSF